MCAEVIRMESDYIEAVAYLPSAKRQGALVEAGTVRIRNIYDLRVDDRFYAIPDVGEWRVIAVDCP